MPDLPHHRFDLQIHLGALHLDVALRLTAPWTVLFGPSASGKTTLLRALCGLIPCDADPTPPHRRNLAYAPQNPSIFPHLSVRENIAFPMKTLRNNEISSKLDHLLQLFDLAPLAGSMPQSLSGGELQRVNLARALAVPAPRLMLLDEPFTGLDRASRARLLPRLQAELEARNVPVLSVTHDVEEALLLNAEIIRLEAGRITAQGSAHQVLASERQQMLQTLS